jgi:hypothetical protein
MSGDTMRRQRAAEDAETMLRDLPERLPAGEELLWQGAPDWRAVARRALHIHQIAAYFAVLLAWAIGSAIWQHGVTGPEVVSTLMLVPLALVAVGLLTFFAWLVARTTTYSITNRRVVLHIGVALPMAVNIPFGQINSAAVTSGADGVGDIALTLGSGTRLAYLIMWPHVRPWRLARPEPALRGLPDAAGVARILARGLAAAATQPVAPAPDLSVSEIDRMAARPAAA